jgi:aldehyde dehydrogenase (NAD+)
VTEIADNRRWEVADHTAPQGDLPRYEAVIGDGRWIGERTIVDADPATGQAFAVAAACGPEEVDAAVAAAQGARGTWSALSAGERGDLLRELARLIGRRAEELAELESRDVGKPLSQARAEMGVAARFFSFYADAATGLHGETIPVSDELFGYTIREPFGVVGHIVPWNYPLATAARTVAPSLAAGNCSVLKPSEEAPLTAIRLGELAQEAGLPSGVLNVVPGSGTEAGAALAGHEGVALVSFTGSVETGRAVAKAAAEHCVPVLLELGGKSPNIVFADADLDTVLPTVTKSLLQNCGQTCHAGTRVLAQEPVHETIVARLVEAFERVSIGPGLDDPDLGPLISQTHRDRVKALVDSGTQEASLIIGGGPPEDPALADGSYFAPTIFDDVPIESTIAQEEVFGPVLAVTSFTDVEEARALANGTRYGLVAGVWTRDVSKAHWLARHIDAGQVFINAYGPGTIELPFGGYKYSGYGREKGTDALLEYTQCKTVGVGTVAAEPHDRSRLTGEKREPTRPR